MQTILRFLVHMLIFVLALAGCAPAVEPAPALVNATSTPPATQVRALPTALPGGQAVEYQGLRATMLQADLTGVYDTEFGYQRQPTANLEFLWVHLQLENISTQPQRLPALEHFSAIHGSSEYKPAYGHRKDHPDYTALPPILPPSQKVDAWLRFDVPAGIVLQDLRFVYLPDSLRVDFSFSGSGYAWADHPQFFWLCGG